MKFNNINNFKSIITNLDEGLVTHAAGDELVLSQEPVAVIVQGVEKLPSPLALVKLLAVPRRVRQLVSNHREDLNLQ